MKNFNNKPIVSVLFILLIWGNSQTTLAQSSQIKKSGKQTKAPFSASEEADRMASMAGIACIYADWQKVSNPDSSAFMRGYNIGSILIDWRGDTTVSYALNSVGCFHNGTQHGEVRAMQQHTFCNDLYYLDSCTIYTNLEPCAMCAGMMCLEKVNRAVYAQHDPCFGGALQRLQLNSDSLQNGYPPYPRITLPDSSQLPFYQQINAAYNRYCNGLQDVCDCNIVAFLASDSANSYYSNMTNIFLFYEPVYPQNNNLYAKLFAAYNSVVPCNGMCTCVTGPTNCGNEFSVSVNGSSGSVYRKGADKKKKSNTLIPPGHRR